MNEIHQRIQPRILGFGKREVILHPQNDSSQENARERNMKREKEREKKNKCVREVKFRFLGWILT